MNIYQPLARRTIILALVVFLTGCLSSKPIQTDIVGLWVEYSANEKTSSPCGMFEFFDDGRFEAKNIPSKYFVSPSYSPERIDASGTWELDTSSNDPFAVHQIKLLFEPFEKYPLGLESVLYVSIDDGLLFHGMDDKVLFKKGITCE